MAVSDVSDCVGRWPLGTTREEIGVDIKNIS
jgi:hypothetical protein